MARKLISDDLWSEIKPLIPVARPRRKDHPGRRPLGDREALTGIVFIIKSGMPWENLPREMGCGSGMTCWRRLRDWQKAGVWNSVKRMLIARLSGADEYDWARAENEVHHHKRPSRRKNGADESETSPAVQA